MCIEGHDVGCAGDSRAAGVEDGLLAVAWQHAQKARGPWPRGNKLKRQLVAIDMTHPPGPSRLTAPRSLLIILVSAVLVMAGLGTWWAARSTSSPTVLTPSALPDETRMGVVELMTADLAGMRSFYADAVGLDVLTETDERLSLGSRGEELLTITQAEGRAPDEPSGAGLYHSAILYPDRESLARALVGVATVAPSSYAGSADHAVSLAFYFADPDGNGLELYVDTPRDEWVWEDGLVQMGSAPLDPDAFIQEHLDETSNEPAAGMGHVHLRVGDLQAARAFYADTLGFAVTAQTDGALFFAAGGYHHHLATNTWHSEGGTERAGTLGLDAFTVRVGDETALRAVADRLAEAGAEFTHTAGRLDVEDPWGNTVRLLARK